MSRSDQSTNAEVDGELREGRDYRVDAWGRFVFTAAYLRRRGTCCGNKCRNCPYGWSNVPPHQRLAGEPQPPLDEK